jgi:hypothetical protein
MAKLTSGDSRTRLLIRCMAFSMSEGSSSVSSRYLTRHVSLARQLKHIHRVEALRLQKDQRRARIEAMKVRFQGRSIRSQLRLVRRVLLQLRKIIIELRQRNEGLIQLLGVEVVVVSARDRVALRMQVSQKTSYRSPSTETDKEKKQRQKHTWHSRKSAKMWNRAIFSCKSTAIMSVSRCKVMSYTRTRSYC